VRADLSVPGYPEVLVIGDQAHFKAPYMERPLPGVASVAIQQGKHAARVICADLDGTRRSEFRYVDKGQMATIGRRRAIVEFGRFKFAGFFAWLTWLFVHVLYLIGFKNRLEVVLNWSWNYFAFSRGARLIVVGPREVTVDHVPVELKPWSETTEVADILSFDVGIMPLPDSPWERGKCGYKLIQYMACARPVIVARAGGAAELFKEGDHAFGFEPGNVAKLAEVMMHALDPDVRARLGRSARQHAVVSFGRQRLAGELLQVYAPLPAKHR
jgi:glycosyltransferase involved in cell wall biosynthesis